MVWCDIWCLATGPADTLSLKQIFEDLLALNSVHERVLSTTWFGSKERSRLYNALPTASKRDMDMFEADWKKFNFFMMRESEEVSSESSYAAQHIATYPIQG